jgi:hypothetical protein
MKRMNASEPARDILVVAGAVAVASGLWLISPSVALIVAGLLLAGIGVAWQIDIERRKAEAERNRRRGL